MINPQNVKYQFPDTVKNNELYSRFLAFIEDYYKFNKTKDISNQIDIDKTDFIDNILYSIGKNFGGLSKLSDEEKKVVLLNLIDIYKSKGSEESYKIIFSILFKERIEIKHPSDQIFKASSAKYIKDIAIRFSITSGFLSSFSDFSCIISVNGQKITKMIKSVEKKAANLYEAVIEDGIKIQTGGRIESDTFIGELVQTITSYQILNPAQGFMVGDIFNIESPNGNPTKVRVKRVKDTGLKVLEFIQYGWGYETDIRWQIFPDELVDEHENSLKISLNGDNSEYNSDENINRISERVLVSKYDYTQSLNYFQTNTYVGQLYSDQSEITTSSINQVNNVGLVIFRLGYVLEYPGYYLDNIGFSSDTSFIQDGDYYQQFSYVIKSKNRIGEYEKIIKELVHPAGTKMFGEFVIENTINIFIDIQNILNKINTSYIDDVSANDDIDRIELLKTVETVQDITDSVINTFQMGMITDEAVPEDDSFNTLTKVIADIQEVTDTLINRLEKNIVDEAEILDFFPKTITKNFINNQEAQNFGGVLLNPYYSEFDLRQKLEPYWAYGYTVNERIING